MISESNRKLSEEHAKNVRADRILVQFLQIIFQIIIVMKKLFSSVLLVSLLLVSCSKEEIPVDPDNLLIGTWTHAEYNDNASVYTRATGFNENPGYKFCSDGTLIERRNSGWCGTPPVSYGNYDGTWTVLNDTLIRVNTTYWGGDLSYKLDIETVNSKTLKVVPIYENK